MAAMTDDDISLREIALRLANIEALLSELLERKKSTRRAAVRRTAAVKQRVRDEVIASGFKPSERQSEVARRFLASKR